MFFDALLILLLTLLPHLVLTGRPKDSLKITTCRCHEIYHPPSEVPNYYVSGRYLGIDYHNTKRDKNYAFNVTMKMEGPSLRDDREDGLMQPFQNKVCQRFEAGEEMCYEKYEKTRGMFRFNGHKRYLSYYDPIVERPFYFEVLGSCEERCRNELGLKGPVNVDLAALLVYDVKGIR